MQCASRPESWSPNGNPPRKKNCPIILTTRLRNYAEIAPELLISKLLKKKKKKKVRNDLQPLSFFPINYCRMFLKFSKICFFFSKTSLKYNFKIFLNFMKLVRRVVKNTTYLGTYWRTEFFRRPTFHKITRIHELVGLECNLQCMTSLKGLSILL